MTRSSGRSAMTGIVCIFFGDIPIASFIAWRTIPSSSWLSHMPGDGSITGKIASSKSTLGELLSRHSLIRLQVLLPRPLHHVGRQFRRRAVFVPAGRFQPVAHELFVEGWRADAQLVLVGGPEAGAVGGQHFVDE